MTNPLTPNYVPGVGRLVTDRYDFQSHVDGASFRHQADQIDLSPTISIQNFNSPDVQDAIQRLANIVSSIPLPDATTSSKGVIQLSGDIAGVAANVKVTGLQGFPVSSGAPSNTQVLTWNGSVWSPQNPSITTNVTMGGNVTGNSTNCTVVSLQNRPVSATAPTTSQVLAWNGSSWTPQTPSVVSSVTMGGDVVGNSSTTTVTKLQGNAVSSAFPATGQGLVWNGTVWTPSSISVSGAAGGDLAGSYPNPTVHNLTGTSGTVTLSATNLNSTAGTTILQSSGNNVITYSNTGIILSRATTVSNQLTVQTGGISVLAGGASITGATTLSGSLATNGTTTATGKITINTGGLEVANTGITVDAGGVVISAGGLVSHGGANIFDTLTVSTGGANISGLVTASSGLTVTGASTFNSNMTFPTATTGIIGPSGGLNIYGSGGLIISPGPLTVGGSLQVDGFGASTVNGSLEVGGTLIADSGISMTTSTVTSVSGGGASPLPSAPIGYFSIFINGFAYHVPYYP